MNNLCKTVWKGGMNFESENASGHMVSVDVDVQDGGSGAGYRPKSLMLTALAGCSGLDVVSLFQKMKVPVRAFEIDIDARLTEEHPKYYDRVKVVYHFYGDQLDEKKLERCVELSVTKYCGVMEMFRRFSEVSTSCIFHHES